MRSSASPHRFTLSRKHAFFTFLILLLLPFSAVAETSAALAQMPKLSGTFYGYASVAIFVLAYALVPLENNIHLLKSKPVLFAAGIIWVLVALAFNDIGASEQAHYAIRHAIIEYAELFLFLLVAMTYINALEDRNVFQALRAYLVSKGYSLKKVFWVTGALSFVISPIADNLTTALLMGAVVMAVGGKDVKFISIACINVVIAANAGGAFSPFGDITTLMVWQKGKVEFLQFLPLFVPSLVNWLVPALIMSFALPDGIPQATKEKARMKRGAQMMMALFLATIVTAVSFHSFLHLPPAAGMMFGLGYLGLYSFYLKRVEGRTVMADSIFGGRSEAHKNPLSVLQSYGKHIGAHLNDQPYPAFMLNTEHEVTHWNQALEALTGIKAADVIGTKNHWQAFYKSERPTLADVMLDDESSVAVRQHYGGLYRDNPLEGKAYDAANYFENIGQSGAYLMFSAAPVTDENGKTIGSVELFEDMTEQRADVKEFDVMERVSRAEWDTLLFFYGVIMCVAGLSQFGYMAMISELMYNDLGAIGANALVGLLSAIVDNIPVMFAVLTMDPVMPLEQWQLVTLTAGVGGSMLAIGSAAGVALLGTARGVYTFASHLKWTPVIALGYVSSIGVHLWLNGSGL
ncbi:sodium:proton antiporter NhaD [Alteromonas sp. ASW11-36]|uniref:Sodium:proton antiporter NhaD n=1 Tax=Alteromonas arenosi TaxID=3055817 RepID=A0ABT7SW26_9ALTE|nr:sodium:proton antiporter NhaD [Alteromonas sp. ASW11-36]MDM7860397.1 sodium:proton antiporter NhaD [Alteromonas sp. ASW11-36]